MTEAEGGVFVPCNEKFTVIAGNGRVDVWWFVVKGEGVYSKMQGRKAEKVCHEVLLVSWFGGDKSAESI